MWVKNSCSNTLPSMVALLIVLCRLTKRASSREDSHLSLLVSLAVLFVCSFDLGRFKWSDSCLFFPACTATPEELSKAVAVKHTFNGCEVVCLSFCSCGLYFRLLLYSFFASVDFFMCCNMCTAMQGSHG
jgi:membrane-associated HD superfamily phosphohydrolase